MYASFGDYLFFIIVIYFFTTLLSVRIWSIFPFYSQPTGLLDVRTNNYIITSHFLTRFFPPQLPTFLYSLIYNVSHSLFLPSLTLCYLLASRFRFSFLVVLRLFLFPSFSRSTFTFPPIPTNLLKFLTIPVS